MTDYHGNQKISKSQLLRFIEKSTDKIFPAKMIIHNIHDLLVKNEYKIKIGRVIKETWGRK